VAENSKTAIPYLGGKKVVPATAFINGRLIGILGLALLKEGQKVKARALFAETRYLNEGMKYYENLEIRKLDL